MKTISVTGAAGGIDKAICDVFYQADYRVISVDRHLSGAIGELSPVETYR